MVLGVRPHSGAQNDLLVVFQVNVVVMVTTDVHKCRRILNFTVSRTLC